MNREPNWDLQSMVTLNSGANMPRLGLGTARMTDPEVVSNAVKNAIQVGYRLVDTAKNYGNEEPVGRGIRESGIPEDKLFITTKLEKEDYGFEAAKRGFEGSYERLGLKKIDLYLIHAPEDDPQARLDAWAALAELVDGKRLRAIGVSNYQIEHFEEIQRAGLPVPAVNQIKLSPFNYAQQRVLVDWCQRHTVYLMAYSPLGVGAFLSESPILRIANRYNKTPAQVLLRWSLQHDFIVIPKSDQLNHIQANGDVFDFEISQEEMDEMDALGQ